jgi:hypothetical protein
MRRVVRFVVVQVIIVAVLFELTVRVLRPLNADVDRLLYLPSLRTGYDRFETTVSEGTTSRDWTLVAAQRSRRAVAV